MIDFKKFPGSKEFEVLALPYLRGAVERFLGGKVKYEASPTEAIKTKHTIDITENPRRGVYILDDSSAIVLGRVLDERDVKAAFALHITESSFKGLEKLLNDFEAALAITLSRSSKTKFGAKPHQFGDELIELAISKYFSKGYYDHRSFQYLIDIFHNLANTQFEGRNFTTGLIITRSHYAFAEKGEHTRQGTLFPLLENRKLAPNNAIEKRFWYLADGQTSYYICNPKLEIGNLFVSRDSRQTLKSFVDDYSLAKTVRGGDALFRVTSQSEFSIMASGGIEFSHKEGRWRVRNLNQIAEIIRNYLGVDETFVQSFLYYVFYLSRRRLSSILWVPKNLSDIDDLVLSKNQLTKCPFSILEETHTQSLLRLLSSDGATVIDLNGKLISFGSVIDISKISITGVKGTGESVSALLANNGLSVKVSQDGTIKLFPGSNRPALVI